MRYILETPLKVATIGKFLGKEEDVKGHVVALEFYENSIPTFTFQSETGHLFAYLPPNAFDFESGEILADIECPGTMPSVSKFNVRRNGFGKVGDKVIEWKEYICSIDWDKENILIHCVRLENGNFAFLRNSRFQIGGTKWNPPNWRKLKQEWTLK